MATYGPGIDQSLHTKSIKHIVICTILDGSNHPHFYVITVLVFLIQAFSSE